MRASFHLRTRRDYSRCEVIEVLDCRREWTGKFDSARSQDFADGAEPNLNITPGQKLHKERAQAGTPSFLASIPRHQFQVAP